MQVLKYFTTFLIAGNSSGVVIDIYWYLWVLMGIYGYLWVFMGIYGYLWVFQGIYGYKKQGDAVPLALEVFCRPTLGSV